MNGKILKVFVPSRVVIMYMSSNSNLRDTKKDWKYMYIFWLTVHFYVWFMSYSKCWNCRRTLNICFLLISSWKMLEPNIAFWGTFMLLRCLNSKEIKLQSSIRVICIIFDLIFFSWKLKRKQRFQVRRLFQRFEYDMNQT